MLDFIRPENLRRTRSIDLIMHGNIGFVISEADDAALAQYVAVLLTNPGLYEMTGEATREKTNREFGLDRLFSETLTAYRAAGWKGE